MTVYIDVLFVLNLVVNYFTLLAAGKLGGASSRFFRLFLGAALGAVYSLIIFMPKMSLLITVPLQLLFSFAMILTAFGLRRAGRFLRLAGVFYLVSFAYAGMMMAIWLIFRPNGMAVGNGIVYFDISPMLLIVSTVASYGILSLIRRFWGTHTQHQSVYKTEIILGNATVSGRALLDTGNSLVDLFSGAPVIVAEYALIKDLIPSAAEILKTGNEADLPEDMQQRFRLIPYSAIGGKGLLPAFRSDGVTVRTLNQTFFCKNAVVAVSIDSLGGRYNMLIGKEMLYQGEGKPKNEYQKMPF
ncbi:MAG TPA: hypothetical protein DEQ02_08750 [Ruminococcaceae bacterium]|nr:hypothetical protein [Oscillospiraceae bacterium]